MMRLRDLDDYDDAELMRKKIEACLSIWVTRPDGGASPLSKVVETDTEGRVERLYPGGIHYGKPGESAMMHDPTSSSGYADFKRFSARDICAGLGLPYELVTGDLSQVNYSSYRAGLVRFRRRLEQDQWLIHIPSFCVPVWNRFLQETQTATRSPTMGSNAKPEWTPPRFELIDPLKETQAEVESVLAGFDTWPQVVRRRGWSDDEQLEEIEKWQTKLAERGIVLKSDHTHAVAVAQTGMKQAPPTDDEPDEDDEEAA
jgi:lambda family phage portal protein